MTIPNSISSETNILHVTHLERGGIHTYIDDLVSGSSKDFNALVLKSFGDKLELDYRISGVKKTDVYYLSKKIQLSDFYDKEYEQAISLILKSYRIHIIHISSGIYHTFNIFKIPKLMGIPVIFTVHDFFYICPSIHLVGKDGVFCGMCRHKEEKDGCLNYHPYVYSKFDRNKLRYFRDEFFRVKKYVDFFVFPSQSAKDIFSGFYRLNEAKCRVIGHGTALKGVTKNQAISKRSGLRVGILGSMLKHKGKHLISKVLRSMKDDEIEFIHFGDKKLISKNLRRYGRYHRSDIINLLTEHQIDVVMLLSLWPETFSYTLSEAMAARIPVIVTNFGALKERVESSGIGWVVDHENPESICSLLRSIKNDKSKIENRAQRIAWMRMKTLREMVNDYKILYQEALSKTDKTGFDKKSEIHSRRKLERKFGRKHKNRSNVFFRIENVIQKTFRRMSHLIHS